MQREEGIELRSAGRVLDEVAANSGEVRISGRRQDLQTVGGTTLDDEDEAPIGICPGERHLGQANGRERTRDRARMDE
jgi:hypothetical protein